MRAAVPRQAQPHLSLSIAQFPPVIPYIQPLRTHTSQLPSWLSTPSVRDPIYRLAARGKGVGPEEPGPGGHDPLPCAARCVPVTGRDSSNGEARQGKADALSLTHADDYLFKLLLIGDSGTGKSCLLLR